MNRLIGLTLVVTTLTVLSGIATIATSTSVYAQTTCDQVCQKQRVQRENQEHQLRMRELQQELQFRISYRNAVLAWLNKR